MDGAMFAGLEAQLDDLVLDPIVQLLMHSDRISPTELEQVLDGARRRLGRRQADLAAQPVEVDPER